MDEFCFAVEAKIKVLVKAEDYGDAFFKATDVISDDNTFKPPHLLDYLEIEEIFVNNIGMPRGMSIYDVPNGRSLCSTIKEWRYMALEEDNDE